MTRTHLSSKDPTMMKAAELKAGIIEMGGNAAGLVEKAELVALYRELQAAPRTVVTKKYSPEPEPSPADNLRDMTMDPDMMGDVDPNMMREMMGNPMIQVYIHTLSLTHTLSHTHTHTHVNMMREMMGNPMMQVLSYHHLYVYIYI